MITATAPTSDSASDSISAPASPSAAPLTIGEVAAAAGVSVQALRYYERRGLLLPSARRASGYREYPPDAVQLVRFVKRAQDLGFTLAEVDELARLRARAAQPEAAREARAVAAAKVREIDARIQQLQALRGALAGLVTACEASCGEAGQWAAGGCPIIGALEADDALAAP